MLPLEVGSLGHATSTSWLGDCSGLPRVSPPLGLPPSLLQSRLRGHPSRGAFLPLPPWPAQLLLSCPAHAAPSHSASRDIFTSPLSVSFSYGLRVPRGQGPPCYPGVHPLKTHRREVNFLLRSRPVQTGWLPCKWLYPVPRGLHTPRGEGCRLFAFFWQGLDLVASSGVCQPGLWLLPYHRDAGKLVSCVPREKKWSR